MRKFKIGDTVVRNQDADESFAWLDFVHTERPKELVVTSVNGSWIQVNGYALNNGSSHPFHTKFFSLVDDELPPAPGSVQYFNSTRDKGNYQRLVVDYHKAYSSRVSIGIVPSGCTSPQLAINLDADAALQLCHDLRRMAMELKRKEK